jgi:CTP-dependent riboflavin kinase
MATYLGKVKPGVGKDSKRGTWEFTEELLGYIPYPGTLNVFLDSPATFWKGAALLFDEFLCVEGTINDVPCNVCIKKNRLKSRMVFVVAPFNLRDMFGLVSNSTVELEF